MSGLHPSRSALLIALGCSAIACTRDNPAFRSVARGGEDARMGPESAPGPDASQVVDVRLVADAPFDLQPPRQDAALPDAAPAVDVAAAPPDRAAVPADAGGMEAPRADGPGPLFYYDFESGTDGWKDIRFMHYGVAETPVATSGAVAHHGARALAMTLRTADQTNLPTFGVDARPIKDRLTAGTRIEQWVWFPVGARLLGVQGFVYCYRRGEANPRWEGQLTTIGELTPGAWNRIEHQVPQDVDVAAGGVVDFGIEWNGDGPLTQPLTVYVDDVSVRAP